MNACRGTELSSKDPKPGVSRDDRITDEGLARLEKQLASGRRVSQVVLDQWIKRYGDAARAIIDKYVDKD